MREANSLKRLKRDDKICVQGVAEYSFTDADGGPEGAESDDEVDEADEADVVDGEVDDGGVEANAVSATTHALITKQGV